MNLSKLDTKILTTLKPGTKVKCIKENFTQTLTFNQVYTLKSIRLINGDWAIFLNEVVGKKDNAFMGGFMISRFELTRIHSSGGNL